MKETMYSGVCRDDDTDYLIWVVGDVMAVTPDDGEDDPWRDAEATPTISFNQYVSGSADLDTFTDLSIVWERG